MRKVIAERSSYSKKEVPHFYLTVDCNVDELLKGRHLINNDLDKYKRKKWSSLSAESEK